jgi:hypothetical protein
MTTLLSKPSEQPRVLRETGEVVIERDNNEAKVHGGQLYLGLFLLSLLQSWIVRKLLDL